MLNANQIGTLSPPMPLALLRQRPAGDWLLAEPGDLRVLSVPTAGADPLSRVPLGFLRQLAADDRLRAELEADPAATLARHGVRVPPEAIPAAVSLPSSEALDRVIRASSSQEDESARLFYAAVLGGSLIGALLGED